MNDLDATIKRLQASYTAAVFERDAEALIKLYDPDLRVFDAWGIWQHSNAAAWQRSVEGWFASLGTERVRVSFEETASFGSSDTAVMSAIVTYASVSAAGDPLRSMQNRITWGLRTRGHVLRIIHEHTSAPIGFEDMKAILTRAGA